MKLQNQVCTLKQAKQLKELGVNQTSIFRYEATRRYQKGKVFVDVGLCLAYAPDTVYIATENYSAFTVAELGVMLPKRATEYGSYVTSRINDLWVDMKIEREPLRNRWVIHPINGNLSDEDPDYSTEAEARAAVLISLLENNLTTAEEVNQRLQSA